MYVSSLSRATPLFDAAQQENRMRLGNKKIYHLEAWVVKVMSLYKVRSYTKF
jgi:hypothetical protein